MNMMITATAKTAYGFLPSGVRQTRSLLGGTA